MSGVLLAVGLVVVVLTGASVLFTMVLPRRPRGIERATLLVNRVVRIIFVGLSRLARSYEGKDAVLAPTAPVALVAQLVAWAALFILGFGLILQPTTHDLPTGLLQAMTALFTVGTIHAGGPEHEAGDMGVGAWGGVV